MKIEGAVALVTGGASGIGKAVCEKLLNGRAKVYFLDKNKATGEETQRSFNNQHGEGQAKFICCDVTSKDQLEVAFKATAKEYGRLDIVVNNAAIMDEKDWEKTLNVNLYAVIRGTFLGIELMKNGVIINLSSTGGIHPVSFCPVYCASKFGVIGFTRSIAPSAFKKKGVRVNCVCPGSTDTDIYKAMEKLELTKEQQELATNTPKQRPEAVAQCIVDLIKDETDVGQVVRVTFDEGVEFLNYNDKLEASTILDPPFKDCKTVGFFLKINKEIDCYMMAGTHSPVIDSGINQIIFIGGIPGEDRQRKRFIETK